MRAADRNGGAVMVGAAAAHPMRRIAFLGTHTPRRCGIATFTADLSSAIQSLAPMVDCSIVAMNDVGKHYAYPEKIRCQIPEESLTAYRRAADFLNASDVGILSLQHEYGIFGGKAGAYLLTLLREVRMPVVTTLHTILADPSPSQRGVMDELCSLSERLVVMSASGAELLRRVHGIPSPCIDTIPHGIPVLPDAAQSKAKLGLTGRRVLLTFGLLSPDKGIEHVIDGLVTIAERYPDVVYVVLGATHPHVKEQNGEAYRLMLETRCHRLGVAKNLLFHDRFVSHSELVEFLAAADIYITPYLNAQQITSGTLAYAVGSGKVVVSSPYRYAQEILADGRGVLVPAKDSAAVAREILSLLGDDRRRRDIELRAAALGKDMGWPVVARAYLECFERASAEYVGRPRPDRASMQRARTPSALPEMNLSHLRTLTDDTGLLQHATFTVPRYEDGYCLDDNARALLLLALIEEARIEPPERVRSLAARYLAFVSHAFDAGSGRFRNFMSYSRRWIEPCGSEDSHGRALWALGTVIGHSDDPGRCSLATELFGRALPAVDSFASPRAWAYTLLGIGECLQSYGNDSVVPATGRRLAGRLFGLFLRCSRGDWPWFEDRLTYCNARLPQAMMLSGAWMDDQEMVATGVRSLDWLAEIQATPTGAFAPIGSNGFFVRGGSKAAFDQQPVEACGMISACLQAHRVTGERLWLRRGRQAFNWFLGQNLLERWLYDAGTGGCRDGLHRERTNENQGAESTLSFLMALLDMRETERRSDSRARTRAPEARIVTPEISV